MLWQETNIVSYEMDKFVNTKMNVFIYQWPYVRHRNQRHVSVNIILAKSLKISLHMLANTVE